MKQHYSAYFAHLVILLLVLTLVKGLYDFSFVSLWLGGLAGIIMADLDQLIYVYFLHPEDPISIQARGYISRRKIISAWTSLVATKRERKNLIFHTAHFYLFFLALTFFILTSTASLFGHGLVIGFILHLLTDQIRDFREKGNLDSWFDKLGIEVDGDKIKIYLLSNVIFLLIIGLLF